MLLYSIKHQLCEHKRIIIVWLFSLSLYATCTYLSWNSKLDTNFIYNNLLSSLTVIAGLPLLVVLILAIMKRDDLKSPVAFWNTRPIRTITLFTAKWITLQIVITIPIMLTSAIIIIILERSQVIIPTLIESFIWCVLATSLLGFSAITKRGKGGLLYSLIVVVGIIATVTAHEIFYLSTTHNSQSTSVLDSAFNLFIAVLLLAILFTIFYTLQIRKRHSKFPLWSAALTGIVIASLVITSPFKKTYSESHVYKETACIPDAPLDLVAWNTGITNGVNYKGIKYYQPIDIPLGKETNRLIIENSNIELSDIPQALQHLVHTELHAYLLNGKPTLSVQLKLYAAPPARGNSSSSSSGGTNYPHSDIPKKIYQVRGSAIIKVPHFKEAKSTPLLETLSYSDAGLKLTSRLDKVNNYELITTWRQSEIPLLTQSSTSSSLSDPIVMIEHPISSELINGSSSGSGSSGILMRLRQEEKSLQTHKFQSEHYLKIFKKSGFEGGLDDFLTEAKQVLYTHDKNTLHSIDFDIEVIAPDLELLHKTFKEK